MSFTIHGSDAPAVHVRVMTNAEFADEFGGESPHEDDADVPIVALIDTGNCLAYAIEGNPREIAEFASDLNDASDAMRRLNAGG